MLEKVALNALKARLLARKYGLVPEAGTAWKWALRQLRKGKTLEDLGSAPESLVKSMRKIMKANPRVEYGALHGKGVKARGLGRIVKGDTGSVDVFRSKTQNLASIHSHPDQFRQFFKNIIKQIKRDSFTSSQHVKAYPDYAPMRTALNKSRHGQLQHFINRKRHRTGQVWPSAWSPKEQHRQNFDKIYSLASGDVAEFGMKAPGKVHTVLTDKLRSLYKKRPNNDRVVIFNK